MITVLFPHWSFFIKEIHVLHCKLSSTLLLSHCLVNISTKNIDKVFSMLFFQLRGNVDELCWISFHFQSNINWRQHWVMSSTLRWNNVSTLLINLSFHFQPNINADVLVGNNGYQILNRKMQFYLPIPCDLDFITSANMAKLMRKSITL